MSWRPDGGGFCLCHSTAEHFQRGLSFFDCIPYHREARCDISNFSNCTGAMPEGLHCSRQHANSSSLLHGLQPGITYAFCAIDENPLAASGYDSHALCTRIWTMDSELHFRAAAYSSFMVGLEWTIGNETEQLLNVRMCSSADGCNSLCKDNLIDVRQEKFVAWADLTRQRLRLEARRTDGVLLYNTSFDTHKKTPDRPCKLTASSLGPTSIYVSWILDGAADGFVVTHCWYDACRSTAYPQPTLRHVYVNGLRQWRKYHVTVASFRTVNHTGIIMSEPSHTEVSTPGGNLCIETKLTK